MGSDVVVVSTLVLVLYCSEGWAIGSTWLLLVVVVVVVALQQIRLFAHVSFAPFKAPPSFLLSSSIKLVPCQSGVICTSVLYQRARRRLLRTVTPICERKREKQSTDPLPTTAHINKSLKIDGRSCYAFCFHRMYHVWTLKSTIQWTLSQLIQSGFV